MSGKFLEENTWDYQPVDDEEDPDFDQIVAQNLTDQQFIEENVQLPTSAPAPEVVIAPPTAPEPAPYTPPGDRGPQPEPWTPPVQPDYSGELDVNPGGEGMLPPFEEPAPFENNWLLDQITQQQQTYQDTTRALNSLLPEETLFDERMTPERLDQLEQHRGYGIGPLAGLNYEIVDKNHQLQDIVAQLDAMNPENFTTQAQVDKYNNLVERGLGLESEINNTLQEYADTGQGLIDQQGTAIENLTGSVQKFNQIYGPGGLMDQRREVARVDTRGVLDLDSTLYDVLVNAQTDSPLLTDKLAAAQEEARTSQERAARQQRDRERRQREIIELGATSEQFGQMRDDPGFQEFANQLVYTDRADGSIFGDIERKLFETLGLDTGPTQIAARTNPYGEGPPVPLQTDLVMQQRGDRTLGTKESLIGVAGSPFTLPAYGLLGDDLGGKVLNTLDYPGRTMFNQTYADLQDAYDIFVRTPADLIRGNGLDAGRLTVRSEGQRNREVAQFREEHPWIAVGGEIVLDPLNLVGVGEIKNLVRGARFANDAKFIRGATSLAYEDALRTATRGDTSYIQAVGSVGNSSISKIDSFKLVETQDRFSSVAKTTLGVTDDEAKIFGNRLTYRLHDNPTESWGNILNEELGRLAERNGRTIDTKTAGVFNKELGKQQAFSLLDGASFWEEVGVNFPQALSDTPQWRRARERELPNPDSLTDLKAADAPALDNLVARGHGPQVALDERWADHAEVDRFSREIGPHNYRADYLTPQNTPVANADAVTDDMMRVLERQYERRNKPLETRPTTLGDYWQAWRDLINKPGKGFAPTRSVDDVIRDPRYQALYANKIGDLSQGIVSKWADDPVRIDEIGDLVQASFIQGRDLLDDLLSPGGFGAPASHTRMRSIFNNLPATNWQKAQIKELAKAQKVSIPESAIQNLKWDAARDWIRTHDPKRGKGRDIQSIGMDYATDLEVVARFDKDRLYKLEHRAVIADLMLPDRQGRYRFTRPVKKPDGTTANGWARLSEWELLTAMSKATDKIRNLPTYGPAITEIAETVNRIMGIRAGERPNFPVGERLQGSARDIANRARNYDPALLGDVRNIMDSLVDDVTMVASPAETREFKNWLVSLYDDSYLPRPGKAANPRDYLPDNPNMIDFDQSLSELAVRQAERSSILDQQARFRAAADLVSWTDDTGRHQLDWRELAKMKNADAVAEIEKFFGNPNSPMTLDGFRDLLRQVKFIEPGAAPITLKDIITEVRQLQQARTTVTREIVDWTERANQIGQKVGVDDITSLTNLDPEPNIADFARQFEQTIIEYAQYSPDYSMPLNTSENRALALKDSTIEVAYAGRNPQRESWSYTPPLWEAKIFEGRDRYIYTGEWANNPQLNQRLERAFASYNAESANRMAVNEVASKLTSTNIPFEADDLVSQAMLIHRYSFKEIAEKAGISQNAAKRLRQAINREITAGTTIHPAQIADEAKRLGSAIDVADNFQAILSEQPRRLSDNQPSRIALVGGKLKVPDGLVEPLLSYLDDQYKLSLLWQPSALNKASAKATREILGTVLDYFLFGVTDRVLGGKVMSVLGPEGARYILPNHQRPLVPTFDPWAAHIGKIQWATQGKAYDQVMNAFYDVDPVWGKSAKRLTPGQMGELTKMSKGIKIGDTTAFIGNVIYANIKNLAERGRENITDIYSDILNQADEIVDGGPSAQLLYGEMFDSSEELAQWRRWARAYQKDGRRNWDHLKERWGDLTPHLSVSKMPKPLADSLFPPQGRLRKGLNRAPVLEDARRLDDFINGNLDYKELGLNASERIEADLWRDALKQNWSEIRPQLEDGITGKFRRGVHVNDLDALFQLDHLDPYDVQRFADNMGTVATELEYRRLGYNSKDVSLLLKMNQYVKSTFGFVWLRTAPRYVINNVFGNMVSILLNQTRSDRVTGVRVRRRIDEAMANKTSSLHRHRMMSEGIAGTEFAWGGTATAGLNRIDRRPPDELFTQRADGPFSFIQNSPVAGVARGVKRAGAAYTDFNAKATDFFELDARKRVWTTEFDYHFTSTWDAGLREVRGLDDDLRGRLAGELELSEISKILNEAGVDQNQKMQVFRAYNTSNARAQLKAYNATKDVMRDYLVRNRFDNMMDQIFPYHYWMTKNLMFVTGTVLDRPSTILQGGRIYDTWQQQWQGLPWSMRNKIHITNVPGFVPGLGGKEIAIRPNNITNPAFFILPAVVEELGDAWERYDDMPIYKRLAATTAGGGKRAWEEAGYSAGPHLDAVVGALSSKWVDEQARQMSPEFANFWENYFTSGLNLAIRPQGFEQEVLPLGGLEDAALWGAGKWDKTKIVRQVYADMNRLAKGSDFTAGEINRMGFILYEMAQNGDITKEQFDEIQGIVVDGRYSEIDKNPIGRQVLDRMYAQQGQRSWVNYTTALSYTEYSPAWKDATEADQTYQMLKQTDDYIPYPPNASSSDKKKIDKLNGEIEQLHKDQAHYLEVNNYSADAIAESNRKFYTWNVDEGIGKIYKQAVQAGIEVPQLQGDGPNRANEWAFGKRNPETGQREGGNAPWLSFYWRANDNQADIDERKAREANWDERGRLYEVQDQQWRDQQERYGVTAPYFNQIDEIRRDEQQQLKELYARGLSDTAERRLEDQIMDRTQKRISGVYDSAEQAGVSLRGTGSVPRHTSAWYDLSDSGNGDVRYIYEQAGLGVPRDRELLTLDQAIQLNSVEDQIEAHTTWAMRQVIDSLDLNPYLDSGEPNPRFMREGYFSRELWLETVKRESGHIMNQYDQIVKSYRGAANSRDSRGTVTDLLARPIQWEEFVDFAENDVLSRQSAYDMAFSAALDKVFNSSGEERDALVREGMREFGPRFGDIANGKRISIDMDDVATTISNFYNGLAGDEKKSFEEQWGQHIIDGGDIRVIDPDSLTYRDAVIIADRYGLDIPTYAQEFQNSRNRQALVDAWNLLSKDQQSEFKEKWEADETLPEKFILTLSGADDETGEPYTFDVAAFDELDGKQIAKLVRQMDAPVDSYFPDPQEDTGTTNPRSPKFQRMMEQAAKDKEEEVVTEMFRSGEIFLDSPEEVEAYQSVQNLREQYSDLYDAGRKLIEENGVSWEWLVENLEPTQKGAGEDIVTLRDFAEMYLYTMEQANYEGLLNKRRVWLRGEGQQYAELVSNYLDDRDPVSVDAQAQAEAGTLYGFEGEDLENWQSFYQWREANDHLYTAALEIKNNNDVSWGQLAMGLEDGPIKDFALEYLKRIEDYDMGRLWDQRSAFFRTEHGQSLIARDPDEFAYYANLDGGGGSGGGGRGSSGGPRKSYSGGGRSFGSSGSSARRPSSSSGKTATDFSTPVRDVFRLDSAMMTGDAPDSQARYDVAVDVANLIEKRVEWMSYLLGPNDRFAQLMVQFYIKSIQSILGENPTLELWQQVLTRLGGGEDTPEPSPELTEQPEAQSILPEEEAIPA